MKLLVDRITDTPTDVRFEASAEWWQSQCGSSDDRDGVVVEPLVFDLRVSTLGEDILIEGQMTGHIEVACSRCVERYRQPLREDVRLVLEPAGDRIPAEPESAQALQRDGMCLGDELELGWYRGSEIHLDHFLAEVVSLSLPMQPQPEVDADGRCVECGVDRNRSLDTLDPIKPESPFAVLASLRNGNNGGGS